MASFCVPADKMKKVASELKKIGMADFVSKMDIEKRANALSGILGEKDAKEFAVRFERSLISKSKRATGDFLKKNLSAEFRRESIDNQTRTSIERYILDNILPTKGVKGTVSAKKISEMSKTDRRKILEKLYSKQDVDRLEKQLDAVSSIKAEQEARATALSRQRGAEAKLKIQRDRVEAIISGKKRAKPEKKYPSSDEIVNMKSEDRLVYLKKIGVENPERMNDEIGKILSDRMIAKAEKETLKIEKRRVKSQEAVVKRFISGKKVYSQRTSKSIDDIIAMPENKRIEFLRKYMSGMTAEEANKKILSALKTPFERQIEKDLAGMTNYADVQAYLQGKASRVATDVNGVSITLDEAESISRMSLEVEKARARFVESGLSSDRLEYGRKIVDLQNNSNAIMRRYSTKRDVAISALGLTRGLLTTGEFSSILIQGGAFATKFGTEALGVLFRGARGASNFATNRYAWKNLRRALGAFASRDSYDTMVADFITRDTAILRKKAGLRQTDVSGRLSKMEEDWMTDVFSRMEDKKNPVARVVGKIGNTAWSPFSRFHTAYLNGLRVEAFDDIVHRMEASGLDVQKHSKYLAEVVNDLTGSSKLPFQLEKNAALMSNTFFSARKGVSDIKFWTKRPIVDTYKAIRGSKEERFIAKEGLKRIVSTFALFGSTMSILKLAEVGNDNIKVEDDPTSSDFGDIKIGNARINYMQGKEWIPILASRFLSNGYRDKNDIFREYSSGQNQTSRGGAMLQTVRGKLSPNVALLIDLIAGQNIIGEKFMMGATAEDYKKAFIEGDEGALYFIKKASQREAFNRAVPIAYQTLIELFDEDPALASMVSMPLMIGAGASVYGNESSWIDSTSKEMTKFKEERGYTTVLEAQSKYADLVNAEIYQYTNKDATSRVPRGKQYVNVPYSELTDEEKKKVIDKIKRDTKKAVFKEYKFIP